MKVVYVYTRFIDKAGTERVWSDKMNYLSELSGYEVVLLTYEQGCHSLSFPLSTKVKHVDLNLRFYTLYRYNRCVRFFIELYWNKLLRKRIEEFLTGFQPDIIITSTYFANLMSIIAKSPIRAVKLLESHIDKKYIYDHTPGVKNHYTNWIRAFWSRKIAERSARRFDMLVAITDEDAKDWSSFVKTKIIKNVVHLRNDGVYSKCDRKRVIFSGRFVEQKGLFDLLRIWERIQKLHPDWYLDLYGDGPLEAELIREVNTMQINVCIHSSDDKILDRYCEHSIFVLTSIFEPFGLVIVEAMSCGLPVVSFNCPYGPAEIITNGKDGYLVPYKDIEGYANRICQLIENENLRIEMGQYGIKSSQRYSAEVIMPQWVVLFEELKSSLDVSR